MSDPVTVDQIKQAAGAVVDPEIGRSLADLKMLKDASVSDGRDVTVQIELPTPAYPNRDRLTGLITEAIGGQAPTVKVEYSSVVHGKDSGGTIGLKVKNVITLISV